MKALGIFSALTLLASSTWAAEPIQVEIINKPQQKWQFQQVRVAQDQEGYIVSGRLNAPVNTLRPPFGHIDLAAYTPDGRRIAETTATYRPDLLSPKQQRKGGARFTALIPDELPAGSVIKVAFHRDPITSPYKTAPAHSATIAE